VLGVVSGEGATEDGFADLRTLLRLCQLHFYSRELRRLGSKLGRVVHQLEERILWMPAMCGTQDLLCSMVHGLSCCFMRSAPQPAAVTHGNMS
jgi:hypothetical protein